MKINNPYYFFIYKNFFSFYSWAEYGFKSAIINTCADKNANRYQTIKLNSILMNAVRVFVKWEKEGF